MLTAGWMCLGLSAARAAAGKRDGEQAVAIERAAFQRALSQRMAKGYLMLAQGVEPALAGRLLDEARTAFDRHLELLKLTAPSVGAKHQLAALQTRWAACRAVLDKPPTRDSCTELYTLNDELQAAAHSVLLAFEDAYRSPALRGLMLAGRLRMLSERMAKFWLYRHWNLNTAPADMELHLARAHFSATLLQVERLDLSVAAVAAIRALRLGWTAYDSLLQVERGVAAADLLRQSERVFGDAQALVQHMVQRPG